LNLAKHNPIDSWKTRYVQINCPVDVTVYDENGEILGKITDNQLDESYAGIMMYTVDDQKSIFIDEGEDMQFSIVATDAGTMDISIVEYDLVTGVVSATKEYSTIELKEDKSFSTSISDEIMVEDVELEVVDKEGYRVAIVNEDGTETKDISEQHKHTAVILDKEEATCIEAGLTEGEVCSVCDEVLREQEPIPALGHQYSNGKCIRCGETPCGDLNADGSVNSADVNVIHRYVLDYVELTDEQMILADVNNDGKVNSADVNLLYRYVMGYVQSLIA
jgi:sporulation protein YlmC with PRC-barrel domain